MKNEDKSLCQLPRGRTGRRAHWLAAWPMSAIAAAGLMLYVMVVAAVSGLEWALSTSGDKWVEAADGSFVGWWDIVYFNFISILTVGYGDYSPTHSGARIITVAEVLLGNAILGVTIAAVTAKFLSPPNNAIVFSRYAYYCTEDEAFLIIFVNTSRTRLLNAEIASFFKLGGDWCVRPAVRSPFITRAVQTFFTDRVSKRQLCELLNEDSDVFRFGISGQLGAAALSVAIEYSPCDIVVIPNREQLIAYRGFWDPDFHSPELQEMFHFRPDGAVTLPEFVRRERLQFGSRV